MLSSLFFVLLIGYCHHAGCQFYAKKLPFRVFVLFGVVETKRGVDRGAFVHKLNGTARIGADVADGQQAVR